MTGVSNTVRAYYKGRGHYSQLQLFSFLFGQELMQRRFPVDRPPPSHLVLSSATTRQGPACPAITPACPTNSI